MLARYREVCDTVLRFRDSKEKLIRRAVITLVPRLAAFAPERFVKSYLKQVGGRLEEDCCAGGMVTAAVVAGVSC